jgi:hydrogenase expression/formation protein HypC
MCLAIPVRVVAVEGNVATVDVGGSRVNARLDALPEPVGVGDYILIHAGFAIKRLDPADAVETLRLWEELLSTAAEERAAQIP